MKILGIFLFIFCIIGFIFMGSNILSFIDIPSLIIVFVPTFAAVIGRHGFSGFKEVFNSSKSVPVLKTIGIAALLSGFLGNFIAIIIMLGNLADKAAMGPAMAMLTSFYGVIIYILSYLINVNNKVSFTWSALPTIFIGTELLTFFILLASFTK